MAVHVQVLAAPDAIEDAVEACFRETTTIGLRTHMVQGRALPRGIAEVEVDGRSVRVKRVDRPGGADRQGRVRRRLDAARAMPHARGCSREAERLAEMNDVIGSRLAPCWPGIGQADDRGQRRRRQPDACDGRPRHAWRRRRTDAPCRLACRAGRGDGTHRDALAAARGWDARRLRRGRVRRPALPRQPVDRCFFCKTNLYGALAARAGGHDAVRHQHRRPRRLAARPEGRRRARVCATRSSRPGSTRRPCA